MARTFEKISYNELSKNINITKEEYNNYKIPERNTKHSAGYDFYLLEDLSLKPKEIKKIPTGIKANMNNDEVLMIYIRSSLGFKYNMRMCNQVGIIDSDYYNNKDNEGHIFICVQNESDTTLTFSRGDKIVQGIFTKFLTVDSEKQIDAVRIGGIGSTN